MDLYAEHHSYQAVASLVGRSKSFVAKRIADETRRRAEEKEKLLA
ncbi:hypothetical protein [Glaciihabitans sp. dw_435]|nr:hypothetical protein [Glaciihabitans sp. dw_435]